MASATIQREDVFPAGTTVTAYTALGTSPIPSSGIPPGVSTASGVVAAGGVLTLTGLADGATYILYASSPDRYLRHTTPEYRLVDSSMILSVGSRFDAAAAGTYSLGYALLSGITAGAAGSSGLIYLDPADWAGALVKLRLRMTVAVNSVAPVADFTLNLYPVTPVAGGAASVPVTTGTIVPGSPVAIAAPGAVSLNTAVSNDFALPAAGFYALGLVISAGMAASSAAYVRAQLFARRG